MKLKIKITKFSNKYSFLSHLSCWNDLTCVPQRKKEWTKKTGTLNKREKEALLEFGKMLRDSRKDLETYFLFGNQSRIWEELKKFIGKKKTQKIQNIFNLFEKRFQKIWPAEKEKLLKIRKEFEKRKKEIDKDLNLIKKLCNLTKQQMPKEIELKLILSSNNKEESQGWSYKNIVILECSGWPIKKIKYLTNGIFLHECFHLLIKRNKKICSLIKSFNKKNSHLFNKLNLREWEKEILLEELIISNFVPEGCLSKKILKKDQEKKDRRIISKKHWENFSFLRNFCALNLWEISKKYIEKNNSIDEFYLKKTIECIKKALSR